MQYLLSTAPAISCHRPGRDLFLLQANAEQAVRELLIGFSKDQGLKDIDTVSTVERMDDGTPIRLSITIDRNIGSALFDFEGMPWSSFVHPARVLCCVALRCAVLCCAHSLI